MKNMHHVFQGGLLNATSTMPQAIDPLLLKESATAIIDHSRFGNIQPQYFSDHNYTVWVYDLQLDKKELLPVRLPKVSAAMIYNLNGSATLNTCQSHQLKLHEKSYSPLSIKPDHHTLQMNPGYCKVLFLLFHPPYVSLTPDADAASEPCQLQPKVEAIQINQTCQQLIEDVQKNEYRGELWRLKRQVLILDLFFKSLDEIGVFSHKDPPVLQHPDYEKMIKVQAYIKDNIDKKLSIQMLAQKLHMPPSYLRRTYFQVFKQHMQEYIRKERLHRATVLLIETEMPIREIAWEVGYESAAGFTRVFTFTYRQSPTDYRKKRRKNELMHMLQRTHSFRQREHEK